MWETKRRLRKEFLKALELVMKETNGEVEYEEGDIGRSLLLLLSNPNTLILLSLKKFGMLTIGEIQKELCISYKFYVPSSTLANLLNELERLGAVTSLDGGINKEKKIYILSERCENILKKIEAIYGGPPPIYGGYTPCSSKEIYNLPSEGITRSRRLLRELAYDLKAITDPVSKQDLSSLKVYASTLEILKGTQYGKKFRTIKKRLKKLGVDITHPQLRRTLEILTKLEFVEYERTDNRYKLTDKGRTFLERVYELNLL